MNEPASLCAFIRGSLRRWWMRPVHRRSLRFQIRYRLLRWHIRETLHLPDETIRRLLGEPPDVVADMSDEEIERYGI